MCWPPAAPWRSILPCQDYASSLVTDEGRARFDELRQAAATVITLPYPKPSEQAFLAAGQAVVDRCDHLFAIWDGQPARGLGGTADIVAYARCPRTPGHRAVDRRRPPGVTTDRARARNLEGRRCGHREVGEQPLGLLQVRAGAAQITGDPVRRGDAVVGARLLVPVADLAGQDQRLAVLGARLRRVAGGAQDLAEVVERLGLAGPVPDPPVQHQRAAAGDRPPR